MRKLSFEDVAIDFSMLNVIIQAYFDWMTTISCKRKSALSLYTSSLHIQEDGSRETSGKSTHEVLSFPPMTAAHENNFFESKHMSIQLNALSLYK